MKKIFMLGAFLLGTMSLYAEEDGPSFKHTCEDGREIEIVREEDEELTPEDEEAFRDAAEILCKIL